MGFFGGGGASVANMVGATSSVAGTAGLVPQPAAGKQGDALFGDATFKKTWAAVSSVRAGKILGTSPFQVSSLNTSWTVDYAYYIPIIVPRRMTFDGFMVHSTRGANSQTLYFAIYNESGDEPSSLVANSSASVVNPTNNAILKLSLASNLTLEYGKYFIAISMQGVSNHQGNTMTPFYGWDTSNVAFCAGTLRSNSTITHGTWNDPAPALTLQTSPLATPLTGLYVV